MKQNSSGRWEVLKEGHRRAPASTETKQAALASARYQIRRDGGGEVRVLDRAGKIVSSTVVSAPKAANARASLARRKAA